MCATAGWVVVFVGIYLLAGARVERAAGTPVGLTFGGLAFALMLAATAYRTRKRWRPLVAQRSLGGKQRVRGRKRMREARIHEARSAMADLQAEVFRRTLRDPSEIMRRARRILRSVKASRILRAELAPESGESVRIWLVEKELPGKLENWLLAHSYLGLLAVLLVALHSGFRFGGAVATLGAMLSGIVGVSGVVGACLYIAIPRALGRIKNPLLPPEIRVKIAETDREMASILKEKSGPFQEMFLFSEHELSEEDISKVEDEEKGHFRQLLELQARKRSLEAYLARHLRYEGYLRGWLYVHIPAAAFLLTVVLIHVLSVLYY
ncbi:MAG: hypothetical protein HYZ81_15840 [Nitrospinae bacterium]|nr:hypothetical protein [Nitrospinota bacterium]